MTGKYEGIEYEYTFQVFDYSQMSIERRKILNYMGSHGWKLIYVDRPTFWFMRPVNQMQRTSEQAK